jgi:hypothetical protein
MLKVLAKLLASQFVREALIRRAMLTPYLHIKAEGTDDIYMRRFWLFNPYRREGHRAWLPSVRLHNILRPDRDRHLHDHPWDARTFILSGGYVERREDGRHCRLAGDTVSLRFGEYHTIEHVLPDTWTLFVTWRERGEWGFLVNGRKVAHTEYLAGRDHYV